jgi:hypothetical protein
MKIIDGLKLIGKPAEIPDCGRDDLSQFFVEMGFKVGAEIGVAMGEFSEKLCKAGLKLFAIDPWLSYGDYPHVQRQMNNYYEYTKKVLAPYKDCTIIRKTSMEALADIPDESLDFVYIDGNHIFKYVAEDIDGWLKKVKKGGVISGHDYFYTNAMGLLTMHHVAYVVDAFTKAYCVKNWYVLGQKYPPMGNKRDKWRSWMWLRQ